VCSEQVTLEARPEGLRLVPETVLQLLVEDMPVHVWWRRSRLGEDLLLVPLRDLCDRLIVDTASLADPAARLRELRSVGSAATWRGHSIDLAWSRLEPWREAVASFFDGPEAAAYVERIAVVEVAAGGPESAGGLTAAGAYLAGWLASRLGWERGEDAGAPWRRPDGGRVELRFRRADVAAGDPESVRIVADDEPATSFLAQRTGKGGDFVRLAAGTLDACPLPYRRKLPRLDQAALLCGVLQHRGRDPLFESALACAARIA
jgi:glucose-6-phosphate dehydrogenase assembly protein OpcA